MDRIETFISAMEASVSTDTDTALKLHREIYNAVITEAKRQLVKNPTCASYCQIMKSWQLDGGAGDDFLRDPKMDTFSFVLIDVEKLWKDMNYDPAFDDENEVVELTMMDIMDTFESSILKLIHSKFHLQAEVWNEAENQEENYVTVTIKGL